MLRLCHLLEAARACTSGPRLRKPAWHVAMRPGLRRKRNPFIAPQFIAEQIERLKASVRAKVEHTFRMLKWQSGFAKVRYRRLKKSAVHVVTLFALSNL